VLISKQDWEGNFRKAISKWGGINECRNYRRKSEHPLLANRALSLEAALGRLQPVAKTDSSRCIR
jgi:hypothetical protein